ncbi:MAG: flagellar biosynthesis protein FlhB [Ectothiorhodospiraceae bacterium]|nr:flagellar biosynthesis protein FlhB [Ectothiorhodospiraceae bacterium]
MAEENENGQEKTEQPTPKRLQDAKEKGQVPRSRELNTTVIMVLGAAGLLLFGGYMLGQIFHVFDLAFTAHRDDFFDPGAPTRYFRMAIGMGLAAVAPFALLMLLAALITPATLGGWTFSGKAMQPKLSKMNPVKGLGRMFGPKAAIELVKALAKVTVVGGVSAILVYTLQDDIRQLAREPLETGLLHGAELFFWAFFALASALILVALVDIPYQLWDHNKKLKMTRQEVKDEMKQTEGKPEVKSKVRQLQQQIAQGRMMENVPKADVVITNPTHFAVALRYDQATMRAPRLVAKGVGEIALNIRRVAAEHRVPLFEAPPLARALYHTAELDQEVPAGLYLAVAQVLAYIYQLRHARRHGGQRPQRPRPQVPREFMQYARAAGWQAGSGADAGRASGI